MPKTRIPALALLIAATLAAGPALAGWEEGVAAFGKGDLNTAVNEFKSVVDAQPDWPGGHFMLGRTYSRAGRSQEAITHLRKAYDLDSGNAQYQLFLGEAYVKAGRHADGVAVMSKIDAGKLPAQARGHLAQLKTVAYQKSGQSGSALVEARKAAQADPNNAKLWQAYGSLAYNEGDTDAAVTALGKAAQLDPGDSAKQVAHAQALLRKARTTRGGSKTTIYRQAAAAAQKGVSGANTTENLTLLGECYLGAKDYDKAISAFESAAAKSGSNWLQHYYIGQAHTANANYRSAEGSLKTALDKANAANDQARVWKQLAFVYEKQKNFSEAIVAYNRAGDSAGAQRAANNKATEQENRAIDAENRRLEEMEAEKKRLEEELKNLPGGPPPRF